MIGRLYRWRECRAEHRRKMPSASRWVFRIAPGMQRRAGFRASVAALSLIGAVGLTRVGYAAPITFANFNEVDSNPNFAFSNNGTNASFGTTPTDQVLFTFQATGLSGPLPAALLGGQPATLTVSDSTAASAISGGGLAIQPLNGVMTLSFTRNTPYMGKSNLLTATVTPVSGTPSLAGATGTSTLSLNGTGTPSENVVFSSDFVDFSNTVSRDVGMTFTGVTPAVSICGNLLCGFSDNAAGTFDSDPPPVAVPVTEPASGLVLGTALLGLARFRRKRRGTGRGSARAIAG
jgi:hypothetical protein